MRRKTEQDFKREALATFFKSELVHPIYASMKDLLFDDTSENPIKDLEIANEIAQYFGVHLTNLEDLDKILDSNMTTDLGLRDLEHLYILCDLLSDEPHWLWHDIKDLETELQDIVHHRRQSRIDSSISEN